MSRYYFRPQWIANAHQARSFDNYFEIEVKKYIQVQHNDFTVNFILLHNFKESFFHYLNLGKKVADFSERSSRGFLSTVGGY